MNHRLVLALITCASVARADVWKSAVEGGKVDASRAAYAQAMLAGDEHTSQATASMVSPLERRRQTDLAIASYEKAAAARATEGEPYFRIAKLLERIYVCSDADLRGPPREPDDLCTPGTFKQYAPLLIAALDSFEALAPLDPRFTVVDVTNRLAGGSLLFDRAILRTKLATPQQLALAAADYEKIISRSDFEPSEAVTGNLAETYMMLGRLDESVEMYEESLRRGGSEATYGLAVALDRNGQTDRARALLAQLSDEAVRDFYGKVQAGRWFFVPNGEVFYYFGLINESRGNDAKALEDWKAFIQSGAHPQYQPAAKLHVDALTKKLAKRPTLPMHDIDLEDL